MSYRSPRIAGLFLSTLLISELIHAQDQAESASNEPDKSKQEQPVAKDQAETKAKIFLSNGDTLSGTPLHVDTHERLHFKADSLHSTAEFPLKDVVSLQLDTWKARTREETLTRVELQPRFRETNGDVIMGTLHELTPDSIKIKTWFGGTLSLKRSMVRSLKIIGNSPGNYYGPNSLSEWTLHKGKDSWKFHNASLISQTSSSIGKDVGLLEKSHVSFNLDWKSSARFKVRLYCSDIESGAPDAYYEVNINRSYAYLQTRGKTANRRGGNGFFGGARWRQIRLDQDKKHAKFDFFIDRKTGTITLYIDDTRACILQSQAPDPSNLGTALSFLSEENHPIEISNIIVSPWNGVNLPGTQSKVVEAPEKKDENADTQEPPHKIILSNGDEVPGTVGKVEDGRMIIKTEYTPIKIPINRIKSLTLGDAREEPKKYSGDIRAWLHEGGFITLRLTSFSEGKINGYSQAMGDVSLNLTAFNRIDFLPYDRAMNELRKDLP